jgi:branched-chain amino acid transport system ATP-binding protein
MLLDATGINVRYGRNHAVRNVDIALEEGEVITVLGANGAGKSSLLKAISGTENAEGKILFDGEDISGWSAPRRVRAGLVLVPEGRQIFVSLTVHENLLMGAYCRTDDVTAETEAIYTRFPNLAERRNMPASVLSGGEQQMLAIGRAMLAKPKLMMLDEPSLGLSPILVSQLFELIRDLNLDGLTMILVEQNTNMALATAARGYVLELGTVVLSGSSADLVNDSRLEEAYLGG